MAQAVENGTVAQRTGLTAARSGLQRQIHAWRRLQPTHMGTAMPAVEQRMDEQRVQYDMTEKPLQPEELYIILPSRFPASFRKAHGLERLATTELNLRLGAATDCIRSIRHELRYRAAVHRFQSTAFASQRINTRSLAKLKGVQNRIDHHAAAYRRHREALLALGVSPQAAPELLASDIVALNKWTFGDKMETGEKNRKISWLWLTEGIAEECKNDEFALEGTSIFFVTRYVHSFLLHRHARGVYAVARVCPPMAGGGRFALRGDGQDANLLHVRRGCLVATSFECKLRPTSVRSTQSPRTSTDSGSLSANVVRFR